MTPTITSAGRGIFYVSFGFGGFEVKNGTQATRACAALTKVFEMGKAEARQEIRDALGVRGEIDEAIYDMRDET